MQSKKACVSLVLSVLLLAGCSTPTYMLKMKDGTSAVAQGKPQRDPATGMLIYKDELGVNQAVNGNDVVEMKQVEK